MELILRIVPILSGRGGIEVVEKIDQISIRLFSTILGSSLRKSMFYRLHHTDETKLSFIE